MFTGIIQAVGTVDTVERRGGDLRLRIGAAELPWSDYSIGDSLAVNGVCLTVVRLQEASFETDVSRETLAVTALAGIAIGDRVNLEAALALSDRLGGHLVSGHVDCLGRVAGLHKDARSLRLQIDVPEEFARYVTRKGSVCVDGVSLTINEVSGCRFGVNIIPHTAERTIIANYQVGSTVNIEVDMLMRYLERLLAAREDANPGITRKQLEDYGYG